MAAYWTWIPLWICCLLRPLHCNICWSIFGAWSQDVDNFPWFMAVRCGRSSVVWWVWQIANKVLRLASAPTVWLLGGRAIIWCIVSVWRQRPQCSDWCACWSALLPAAATGSPFSPCPSICTVFSRSSLTVLLASSLRNCFSLCLPIKAWLHLRSEFGWANSAVKVTTELNWN